MKKVTFYIGLNDKDTKVQKISTLEAYKVIENTVCEFFGGATILEAKGVYTHNDNTANVVREKSFAVEVIDFGQNENFDNSVKEFCRVVKIALNQESIAVQYQNFNGELI